MACVKLCSLLLIVGLFHVSLADYCATSMCVAYQHSAHIACNNDGSWGPSCQDNKEIVPIDEALKQVIIDKHNEHRNQTAHGIGSLPSASRMGTVSWNAELATLAELNAKKCRVEHDFCRSTTSFKYAGQNVDGRTNVDAPAAETAALQVTIWFNEYKNAVAADINSFPINKKIGAFTGMVQEKATKIGCAISRHTKTSDGVMLQYLTCNYSYINVQDRAVYTTGAVASACETGVNPSYSGLCNVEEVYDFNMIPDTTLDSVYQHKILY